MKLVTVHIGIFILTALAIVYSDHEAFQYLTGKKPLLNQKRMNTLHYIVLVGLLGMIGTGVIMILPTWKYYFSLPGFWIKMAFVGILITNSFIISSLKSLAFTTSFKELSRQQKMHLFLSGAISSIGWIGALVTALIVLG